MKRENLVVLAVLVAISPACAVSRLDAQSSDWRSFGPPGGQVTSLVADPEDSSTLYAGTWGGPFKSTAGGTGWRPIDTGIGKGIIRILAINPTDPSNLFAGTTAWQGFFRSRDGGETWEDMAENIRLTWSPDVIVFHPVDGSTVYLAQGSIYRSFDGGETWEASTEGPWHVNALALSAARPERLLAAASEAVYVSSDRGATWRPISRGVYYRGLAVDAVDPELVYAHDGGSKVFRSMNGGRSWSVSLRVDSNELPRAVIADRRSSGRAFVVTSRRVLESTDRGASWRTFGGPPPEPPLELAVAADGTVYLATRCGVFRADEHGAWRGASGALRASEISGMAADPVNPGIFYASTLHCGVYRSVDAGVRWQRLAGPSRQALAVAIDPEEPERLYIATRNSLEATADGGKTWNRRFALRSPIVNDEARVAVAATDPRVVYARLGQTLVRSVDRGESFSPVDLRAGFLRYATDFAIDPADAATVYVSKGDLLKTTDGGLTWRAVDTGRFELRLLTFDPHEPSTIYAESSKRVFKSVDDGESWNEVGRVTPGFSGWVTALAREPQAPETIYAATHRHGVHVSFDGAATWQPLGDESRIDFVTSLAVTGLAVHAGAARGLGEMPKPCDVLVPDGEPVTVGIGARPGVTADGAGRALVVWTAADGAAFARALNAEDPAASAPFRLAGTDDGSPAAAADGPGEVLVAWQRSTPEASAVWARTLTVGGEGLGPAVRVDREPRRTKHAPVVARSRTGEAVVVWESVSAAGRTLLRAQRMSAQGAASASGEPITVRGAERLLAPAVATDAFGRFTIVWLESQGQELELWMRRYRTAGTARGEAGRLTVAGASLVEAPPRIAVAPAGEIVAAWLERTASESRELAVRWLDAAGNPVAEQRLDSGPVTGTAAGFDVAVDRFGHALVVRTAGEPAVRAQLFDAAGHPRGEELPVAAGDAPAVAFDLAGGAWVVWEDDGTVRARRLRLTCGF